MIYITIGICKGASKGEHICFNVAWNPDYCCPVGWSYVYLLCMVSTQLLDNSYPRKHIGLKEVWIGWCIFEEKTWQLRGTDPQSGILLLVIRS